MAAVVVAPGTDMAALGQHAAAQLPSYAVPVFLRVLQRYGGGRRPGQYQIAAVR